MASALAGTVAQVTGPSSGIGEAAAMALAKAGAVVAQSARQAERQYELVEKVTSAGGEAIALPSDISVEPEDIRAVEDTVSRIRRLV